MAANILLSPVAVVSWEREVVILMWHLPCRINYFNILSQTKGLFLIAALVFYNIASGVYPVPIAIGIVEESQSVHCSVILFDISLVNARRLASKQKSELLGHNSIKTITVML